MRFSTFSTGFSTIKMCKPYTRRNPGRSFLVSFGQKCGHSAFYKKESRRIFFVFYSPPSRAGLGFSYLEWSGRKFSTPMPVEFPVWKKRGKLWFSIIFPHLVRAAALCTGAAPKCRKKRSISCVFALA